MSLTRRVADLIAELGEGTADDLVPHLPGYTRAQVQGALQNAAGRRLVVCDGRMQKGGKASPYRPGPALGGPLGCIRPPASVFELADSRQMRGVWPPARDGRRLQPLGDWNSTEDQHAA
jgi:hypothetical protein